MSQRTWISNSGWLTRLDFGHSRQRVNLQFYMHFVSLSFFIPLINEFISGLLDHFSMVIPIILKPYIYPLCVKHSSLLIKKTHLLKRHFKCHEHTIPVIHRKNENLFFQPFFLNYIFQQNNREEVQLPSC